MRTESEQILRSDAGETTAARPLVCGGCGFDLRAATGDRCPECGRRFDPEHLIDELIPWEQRKWIGRVRAYVLTVLMVLFRPGALVRKTERPVSLAAAKRFRRVSVAVAWVALAAAACGLRGWAVSRNYRPDDWRDEPIRVFVNPWSFGALLMGLLLVLNVMSVVTAACFGGRGLPPGRRVRVMAIGQYASAALGLVPVFAATSLLGWLTTTWVDRFRRATPGQALDDLATRLTPFPLFLTIAWVLAWAGTACYLLRAIGHSRRRVVATAVGLPVVWAATAAFIPIAFQVLVAWAVLLARSLSWRG
jgi:hypothetical protein